MRTCIVAVTILKLKGREEKKGEKRGKRGGGEGGQEEEGRKDKIGNEATVLGLFRTYSSTYLAVRGLPEHLSHPDTPQGLGTQRETCGSPSKT